MKASEETTTMSSTLNYIIFGFWDEYGHPMSKEYFWLNYPWITWFATIAYLYIVLKAGPDFMRNRKPYDLKITIRIYNLILVAINLYLFIDSLTNFNFGRDFWGCGEALSFNKSRALLNNGHGFFHTRYLEFFDTFFFILRKKNSQISFLHVFHHGVVPTLMYVGLKFWPVPFNGLLPMTNMFVHVVMYAYYGLATFGPGIQKYLWWKKYLTTLQISQFALVIIHCTQSIVYMNYPECNFPKGLILVNYSTGFTFLGLFISFYIRTYCGNRVKVNALYQPLKDGNINNNNTTITNGSIKMYSNGNISESSIDNVKGVKLYKINNHSQDCYNKTKAKDL